MKALACLLLLALSANLLSSVASAAERREPVLKGMVAGKTTGLNRMSTFVQAAADVKLGERLVLAPRPAKGGASVRLNLNF